jgi:hypothetical protein
MRTLLKQTIWLVSSVLLILFTSTTIYADTVCYWRLEENDQGVFHDEMGLKDGMAYGNVPVADPAVSPIPQTGEQNLHSADISSYITLGYNVISPALNGSQALTIEAWVNPDQLYSNDYFNAVFSMFLGYPTSQVGLYLSIQKVQGQDYGNVSFFASSSSNEGDTGTVLGNTNIYTNEWTHIAGVVDFSADMLSVYVNGVFDSSAQFDFDYSSYQHSFSAMTDAIGSIRGMATMPLMER